jgi:inhibitor of cysteine peptidase
MPTIALTASDNGKAVCMAVGDEVTILLKENVTTGYAWDLENLDERLLCRLPPVVEPPARPLPGAGAARYFRFVAAALGETPLRLKLWRQWEGEKSVIERFEVKLQIHRTGNT